MSFKPMIAAGTAAYYLFSSQPRFISKFPKILCADDAYMAFRALTNTVIHRIVCNNTSVDQHPCIAIIVDQQDQYLGGNMIFTGWASSLNEFLHTDEFLLPNNKILRIIMYGTKWVDSVGCEVMYTGSLIIEHDGNP